MPHGSVCWSRICCSSLVQLLALGEQVVELRLAEHAAQRRLRELRGGVEVVLDLDDRAWRGSIDAEVDDRVDLHRDVVARDDVLRRHVVHHRAQAHAHHRDRSAGTRTRGPGPSAPAGACPGGRSRRARTRAGSSARSTHRGLAPRRQSGWGSWRFAFLPGHVGSFRATSGCTCRVSPSTAVTRTRQPTGIGTSLTARQISPRQAICVDWCGSLGASARP